MKPLTVDDILPIDAFLAVRGRMERDLLDAKRARRVAVGPNLTLLFENRLTVSWQIQEMCRVEGITRREAIAHEVETYNALLPSEDELSATLLVEVIDPIERQAVLRRLAGLHRHLHLRVGGGSSTARFDQSQFEDDRISSVQFVRFPLDPPLRAAFADLAKPAEIVVDHPAYAASAALSPSTRGALVEDLATA